MKPLSIYIHIPFCEKKCSFCYYLSRANGNHSEYIAEICKDISQSKDKAKHHTVGTVYFGGGTPNFLDPRYIGTVLDTMRKTFTVSEDAQITVECNPKHVTDEQMQAYRSAGVNRISIGVQSFSDKTLEVLERRHTVEQSENAIKIARKYIDDVGIDLMYSIADSQGIVCETVLPHEIMNKLTHINVYRLQSSNFKQVDDSASELERLRLEQELIKLGFHKYETCGFCKPGYESRHGQNYWSLGEWLGFGDGAHSHFGGNGFINQRNERGELVAQKFLKKPEELFKRHEKTPFLEFCSDRG